MKEKVKKVIKKKVEKKIVAGMVLTDCYRFRAFDNKDSYLGDTSGLLYSK